MAHINKNATKVVAHTNAAEPVEMFYELRQKRRESPTRLSLTFASWQTEWGTLTCSLKTRATRLCPRPLD